MKIAKPINVVLASLLVVAPAWAQYEGPGFSACMNYGEKELMRDGTIRSVVFVNDKDTVIEKYTENVGSQFVSSVLSGRLHRAPVRPGAQAALYLPAGRRQDAGILLHARGQIGTSWPISTITFR
jgi:hypothetical protein